MTDAADSDVLVLGYGNPGRLDDGLGPAFAESLARRALPGVEVDSNYQLTVEDCEAVARHKTVVFVDADATGPEPFRLDPLAPSAGRVGFSTHSVRPGDVLALARDLFGAEPRGYVLAIRGYEFDEFGERLSPRAERNLEAALAALENALKIGELPCGKANT